MWVPGDGPLWCCGRSGGYARRSPTREARLSLAPYDHPLASPFLPSLGLTLPATPCCRCGNGLLPNEYQLQLSTDFCLAGHVPPPPPAPAPCQGICEDSCNPFALKDGYCDDGGPGAELTICALGTDCGDCGPRGFAPPSPPTLPPPPPPLTVVKLKLPEPSVVSTCPFVPSLMPSKSKRSSAWLTNTPKPLCLRICPSVALVILASDRSLSSLAPPPPPDTVPGSHLEFAELHTNACPFDAPVVSTSAKLLMFLV